MKAPLIFCSANASINVLKIFKVVLAKAFDLRCNIEQITNVGFPGNMHPSLGTKVC